MPTDDGIRALVDRHADLVDACLDELEPLLQLPGHISRLDLEHAGYNGLVGLAERVDDGPGFTELAKWAIRSAIIDYVVSARKA